MSNKSRRGWSNRQRMEEVFHHPIMAVFLVEMARQPPN